MCSCTCQNIHEERCYHTMKKDIMRVLPDSNPGLRESSVMPVKPDKMVKGDQIITAERQKAGGAGRMVHSAHVSGHLGKSIFRLVPNLKVIFFLAKRVDSTTSLLLLTCERDEAQKLSTEGQDLSLTCCWKEQFCEWNWWRLRLWSELQAITSAQSKKYLLIVKVLK